MHFLALYSLLFALPIFQGELIQVIQIARHGARTPNSFELFPNQYTEKEGELTALGIIQHFFLGQEMRKRYIENTNFLQEKFNRSEVLVRSSWKNRTVRSAFAFINGLYLQDEGEWFENIFVDRFPVDQLLPLKRREKTIEVHDIKEVRINETWARESIDIISLDGDLYFHAAKDGNCPPAEQVTKEIKKSSKSKQIEAYLGLVLYPALVEGINSHVGVNLLNIDELNLKKAKSVLDNYRCNFFHRRDYPHIDDLTLKFLIKARYLYAYQIMLVDDMVRAVSATKLLSEFLEFTKSAQDGMPNTPKFVFYSAHDTTLEILFTIFLLESTILSNDHYNIVPFASVISFELHKEKEIIEGSNNKEIQETYYIKMFYNDEPQPMKWCLNDRCTLDEFHKILEHYILPDLEELCDQRKPYTHETKTEESYCFGHIEAGKQVKIPCN